MKILRLFSHIHHNLDEYLIMKIGDDLSLWQLVLYTDADLSGEKAHSRSTSGNILVIGIVPLVNK